MHKSFFIPHLQMMISFFFLVIIIIIPFATPLSFDFPSIGPDSSEYIIRTGNATMTTQGIQLTPDPDGQQNPQWNTGRATYVEPLHLWDGDSREPSDFTTHFSFVIRQVNGSDLGEGFAFFLASNGSTIPPDSAGGRLGLESMEQQENRFVAVEFDTYRNNEWEANLPFNHVGILINSMVSVANTAWPSFFIYERIHEAWISYDSVSRNLSVDFTCFNQDGTQGPRLNLNYVVDLSDHLPEWVVFGFSASTGGVFEENNIRSWQFNANIPGNNIRSWEFNSNTPGNNINIRLIVGLSVVLFVLVVGLVLGFFFFWMKKRNGAKKDNEHHIGLSTVDDEFEKGIGPKKFSYDELDRATNNFSEEEKLGEGGFGGVYKGFLRELNSDVAVKKISKDSKQGLKEYISEVKIISRSSHKNLVQLIGWCHEKKELLLVYEFMPNGSLDFHLFEGKNALEWEMRYKIAKGLASALLYLHEEGEQYVLHRDIKSSNVMLDSNFNAKLGDFGLARLVDYEKELSMTDLAGTRGYMSIDYVMTQKATKQSDVYSFGVVALEIASGRKASDFFRDPEKQTTIVSWVWGLHGLGKILEAADQKLFGVFDEKETERLLIVGLWCAHPDYKLCPSIRQAVLVLNFESPLPDLPSGMPRVRTNFAPTLSAISYSVSSSYDSSVPASNKIQSSRYNSNTDSSDTATSSAAYSSNAPLF